MSDGIFFCFSNNYLHFGEICSILVTANSSLFAFFASALLNSGFSVSVTGSVVSCHRLWALQLCRCLCDFLRCLCDFYRWLCGFCHRLCGSCHRLYGSVSAFAASATSCISAPASSGFVSFVPTSAIFASATSVSASRASASVSVTSAHCPSSSMSL